MELKNKQVGKSIHEWELLSHCPALASRIPNEATVNHTILESIFMVSL